VRAIVHKGASAKEAFEIYQKTKRPAGAGGEQIPDESLEKV